MEEVTARVYLVSISRSRYSAVYVGGHAKTALLHAAISAAAHQMCEMLMNVQFRSCRDERSELMLYFRKLLLDITSLERYCMGQAIPNSALTVMFVTRWGFVTPLATDAPALIQLSFGISVYYSLGFSFSGLNSKGLSLKSGWACWKLATSPRCTAALTASCIYIHSSRGQSI